MAFSGGVFTLVAGNPVVTGTVISSTTMNNTLSDIATGLSTCVLKDGSQTITADIPMASNKFTGLAAGSAAGHSLRYEQVFTSGTVTALGKYKFPTTISVGGATPSASGSGVSFPATQSASTDANTLDDYEEGTWTPSVSGTATYTTQLGYYTKIGNAVTVSLNLVINVLGTGTNNQIGSLPFTSNAYSTFNCGSWSNTVANFVFIGGYVAGSSTFIVLQTAAAAANATGTSPVFQDTCGLIMSGTYYTS